MRHTRSTTQLIHQSIKEELSSDSDVLDELPETGDIQDHLSKAQEGLQVLSQELRSLQKINRRLSVELAKLRDEEEVKKANFSHSTLQKQVKDLKGQVRNLEMAREKDQRKIKGLVAKELQLEVANLEEPADHDAGEITHDMRKLLRRFHDLMLSNVLAQDGNTLEKCPECGNEMHAQKCTGLPCEHIVCNDCLKYICSVDWKRMGSEGPQDRGLEITKCPNCYGKAPLEDAEIVVYTAAQRWDELLEVAQEWAKIDTHRAVSETSEEEEEEDFINDKSTDATSTPSEDASEDASGAISETVDPRPAGSESQRPPDSDEEPGTPSLNGQRYPESPTKAKRKRLEALAAERSKRKRL